MRWGGLGAASSYVASRTSTLASTIGSAWKSFNASVGAAIPSRKFATANPVSTAFTIYLLSGAFRDTCHALRAPAAQVTMGPGSSYFGLHVSPQSQWTVLDPLKNIDTTAG